MTHFTDKTGFVLNIRMADDNTGCDFEHDFFEVGGLEQDDNGNYIVDDIDYLVDQAKDCWACRGDYASEDAEPASFYLSYTIEDKNGVVYKLLNSEDVKEMAAKYDVSYSACI